MKGKRYYIEITIIFAFIFITCSIQYAGTKERINKPVLEIIYDNDIAGHLEPCR